MKKQIKKDTNRIDKVNSLIQHELGPVLLEYTEEFKGLVTITKVETSRDMKWAKVWISIFGREQASTDSTSTTTSELDKKILSHLQKNIYDIQGDMNKHFATKIIPRLQFFLDTSPRYVQHIEELVRKIHDEGKN
jgi:ribosome-binding factor A